MTRSEIRVLFLRKRVFVMMIEQRRRGLRSSRVLSTSRPNFQSSYKRTLNLRSAYPQLGKIPVKGLAKNLCCFRRRNCRREVARIEKTEFDTLARRLALTIEVQNCSTL